MSQAVELAPMTGNEKFQDVEYTVANKESVSLHIGAKPSIWDHVFIVVAEFIGTATLLFLSCMGTTMGIQGDISTMQVSFNTGLAVMAVIQMFGHISGAHVNPVVTMSAFILNEITLVQVPLYVISQVFGSLAGVGLQVMVTPRRHIDVTGHGVCVPTPHSDITHLQAFGVEILLTTILIFSICACWDRRNSDKLDSVALRIGLVVGVLNLAAAAYTGASMNPVRTFGPAVWGNDYNAHWVYWIAPTIGSLIATFTYKYTFLRKK